MALLVNFIFWLATKIAGAFKLLILVGVATIYAATLVPMFILEFSSIVAGVFIYSFFMEKSEVRELVGDKLVITSGFALIHSIWLWVKGEPSQSSYENHIKYFLAKSMKAPLF